MKWSKWVSISYVSDTRLHYEFTNTVYLFSFSKQHESPCLSLINNQRGDNPFRIRILRRDDLIKPSIEWMKESMKERKERKKEYIVKERHNKHHTSYVDKQSIWIWRNLNKIKTKWGVYMIWYIWYDIYVEGKKKKRREWNHDSKKTKYNEAQYYSYYDHL